MKNAIILFAIILSFSHCSNKEPEQTSQKGNPIPSFKLLLLDSTTYFDTKDIPNGKPIVLFYFGPRCPYSHAQMKEIIEEINTLNNIRFYILTNWPFPEMKSFYTQYQLSKYQNITIGMDYKNFFANYFEAHGVPYMAIYGKNKKLNESFLGNIYGHQIKKVAAK